MSRRIAFQGEPGAYSHQACKEARPEFDPLPCASFEEAIEAVRCGEAELGMIPIDNSTYGRVADVHRALPASGLHIIDEAYVRVHINLLALPGTKLEDVRRVRSMSILLGQAREFVAKHGLATLNWSDNAAGARAVAELKDPGEAAFASEIAGEIYGLEVLARHVEDHDLNTTRFLIMSKTPNHTRRSEAMVTSFVFRVRNIPAALYKGLGGFATNGINMTKLESYMLDGQFTATQFYAEIDGHPEDENVQLAFEELGFFTEHMDVLGVYPRDPRHRQSR